VENDWREREREIEREEREIPDKNLLSLFRAKKRLRRKLLKKTRIVATIGPPCWDTDSISALIQSGVDVFRLNFSHGTHEEKGDIIDHIRAMSEYYRTHPGIICDLQGPKFRLGEFVDHKPIYLKTGI